MWEDPALCILCADGPGCDKKADWASYEKQASKQQFSMASASVPFSKFLPCLSSYPDLNQLCIMMELYTEINPFCSSCFWS